VLGTCFLGDESIGGVAAQPSPRADTAVNLSQELLERAGKLAVGARFPSAASSPPPAGARRSHPVCNGSRYSAAPFSNSRCRSVEVFPLLLGGVVLERPGAVKGAPLFGAA